MAKSSRRPAAAPPAPRAIALPPRAARYVTPAIVALAVALRAAHVVALRHTPWFDQLVVDPAYYDAWAQRLAAGHWFGDRPFYMDPLYPYVLGVLYAVCGRSLLVARLFNVALDGVACGLLATIGRRLGGQRAGWIAALGFALYEPAIFYAGELDKTTLSVALTAAALAFGLDDRRGARIAAGVALGLATLTRANFLLLAPLVALAIAFDGRRRRAGDPHASRRAAIVAVLFLLGFLAPLAPVMWRSHALGGGWTITTQAGQNFYTGNNPTNPYGAYGALPFVRGNPEFEEPDFRAEAERRVGRPLAAAEVSRFWFDAAFAHMAADPAFAARTMVRKLGLFWKDFEIADNQDQYLLEIDSWVLALPLPGFGAVAALAAAGVVLGARTRRFVAVLAGFVAVYSLSVVAFFIFSRYRIQVVPALLGLGAVGVEELLAAWRTADRRRLAVGLGATAVVGAFAFTPMGMFSRTDERFVDLQLHHAGDVYFQAGQPDRGLALWREAVERCPVGCPQAIGRLADGYIASGRTAEGERYLRQFLARYGPHAAGEAALARIVAARGGQ